MVKKTAAVLRILITFVFLSGLLAPFTTFDVRADEDTSSQPTSGILEVVLQAGDTGQRLAGACWDVYDVNGEKHPYCDFDADGMTSFELVPGAVTVQQTGGPAGYVSTGAGHGSVVAGEIRTLTIVSAVEAAPVAMTLAQEQPATPEVTTTDETGSGAEGDLAEEADPTPEPPAETPTPEPTAIPDTDGDGVLDDADNCVNVANPDQADADENGIGDLCDIVETPTEEPTVEPTATPTEEPATPEASDPSFKLTVKVIDAETEKETTKVDLNRNRDVFFEYTIENTGNVPLTDLKIENTIEGLGQVTCEPDVTTIEPGEILVCAAPYTVTPADGHALFFANDISVSLRFADEVLEQAATTKTDSMFVLEPDAENGGSVGGGFSLAAVDPNAPPESFADAVVSWNVPNGGRGRYDDCYVSGLAPGIAFPSFSGILGVPDSNADINDNVNYSRLDSRAPAIGNGGEIVVQFINNRLVADPTVSGDLMIVERGTLAEEADIYIGNSASGPWIYVGSLSGDTNASEQRFNINGRPGVADWSEWSYVRIVDNPDQGLGNQGCRVNNDPASPDNGRTFNVDGPDLDAVWAISSANASLTKVGDKEWVSAVGEIVNYTFTVRNVGSAPLVFHTITDTIIPWNQISCPAPMPRSLSPGQNIVCTASHTTTAADVARGYVTNVAYANLKTLSGTDVQTEEDDWTYRVRADITVSKVAVNTPILPGGSAQFDITVTNKTAVPALQVTLVDTLPANVSAWSENSTACSISGTGSNPRVLNCSWPSIPGNGSVTVRVTMTAATSGCNPIINQLATVAAWNEHADQQADNTAGPVTIEVTCPIQDVGVTKVARDGATVNPGSPIRYRITAVNNGPAQINGNGTSNNSAALKARFLVTDTLPSGYSWNISYSKSNFTCSSTSNVPGGTVIECYPNDNDFTLNSGSTIQIDVTSTTNASTDACGNFLNRVTVSSSVESTSAPQDNNSAEATVNVPCQDVGIVKSATNATINVGEPISYTIAATNNGPSSITTSGISGGGASATRVGRFLIRDTPPAGYNWTVEVVQAPANFFCNASSIVGGQLLECNPSASSGNVFTILNGGTVTIRLTSTTPATAASCNQISNTATVSSNVEASVNTNNNNSSTATVNVRCADVTVSKTTSTPTVQVGGQISYQIVATNNGPGTIVTTGLTTEAQFKARFRVWDTLPANFTWTVAESVANFACSPTGSGISGSTLVECFPQNANFTLGEGDSVTITLTSSAATIAACGPVPNIANVASNAEPTTGAGGNNNSTATATVACSDVTVVKTAVDGAGASVDEIQTGTPLRFRIVTTNTSTVTAQNVVTSDNLPNLSGVTWSEDSANCSIAGSNPQVLTCNWGSIPPTTGNTRTVTITGTYATGVVCGDVTNTATVTASNEPSSATGNNSSTDTVKVLCSDVTIVKTPDDGTARPGETISFTFSITNLGPDPATGVSVTDTLPGSVSEIWAVQPGSGVNCPATASGSLTCTLTSALAVGAGNARTVTVHRLATTSECVALNNSATVSATNEAATKTGNNTDTGKVTVLCTDISISKVGSPATINVGAPIKYTITVTNTGANALTIPTGALDAVREARLLVRDTLPANYTWTVSESVDNFACTPANPVAGGVEVKCAPANNTFTLAAGGSFTITIQSTTNVTAADCGKTIPNTSRVSSSMEPSTGAGTNNESTGNVTVQCTDVIVVKDTTTQILSVGGSIRYVIEVTNLGPGPVSSLTLTDNTLRSGLTWTPVENQTNWSCAVDGSNDLTCTFAGGTLAVGEKRTVALTSSPTTTADCATFNNTAIVVSPDESAAAASNGNSSTATVTVQCADVVIEKTAPEAPVEVGAPIVFTMVVTNEGPGSITIPSTADAAGRLARLEVRDTLPAGLNWTVTDDKENFSCTPVSPVTGGLTLSCSPTNNDFSFASGQTITITLTSTATTVAQCPSVTNTGAVTSNAETTTMAANGNSSTATATVVCTDVTVLKTAVDDEGEAVESIQTGTPLIFEIVTTNSGSFAAHNVVTRDVLPNLEGVTWTVDNQTDCEISGDPLTLVCDWGSIPATTENTRTVTITGTYDTGDVCGDVANTATVTATNEPGSATGNNSSTDTVKVLCSDVVIDKTPDDGTVYPGGLISFTLTISNLGPDAATDVEVEDTLPGAATATWNVTAGDGVTCPATAQGVLACTLASELAVGEEHARTITVSRQAEVADCALPNNSATVSATNEAADTQGNNTDTGKVTVLCADVMLEKDATSSTVLPGGLVEFTITVTNNGPASATDVVIEDTQLPDGEWTIEPGAGVTCEDETATGSFECTVDGLLPKDESRSVTVSRYAGATECTTLTNTAEVTSTNEPTTPEAVVLNNRDSASVEVLCTEISLIKSPDNGLVSPGTVDSPSLATFTIKVKNNGENDAVGVEVEDTLPPGSAPWTVTTTKGTCDSPATGSFECELGTLVPDEEVTITVKRNVTVADCGLLPNSATATATNDPTGVTDTGLITVTCSDVTVSKTPDSAAGPPAGHILPGATASFTVTLTNNGDFAAVGAKIEDYDLPDGVWDVTPGTGVTCPAATAEGSITCTVNDPVPVNGTRTVTFSRTTTTADCGLLENHARVSATNEDPDELTDNTDSGSITVMCGEVGLEKTAVTASILPGATAEYWITVKSYGPFAAEDVDITDDLPGDGEWTIATQPDEAVSCPATATGSLSCEMTAPLAVDDEIRIHVSKVVTVEDCGPLRNEATVKISNERTTGELHSNTDDATVTVQCSDVALDKTAAAASIYPGDKAKFTILVTNTGDFPATGVEIEDELPAGDWTFSSEISWESDTAELTCVSAESNEPAGSGVASGTLVCTLNETMPVGGNITITLSRATEAGECLDIDNEASVTATNEQPDGEGPNSDEATIEFRCTDIAVDKTPNAGTVYPGETAIFTIVVSNKGDEIAKGVVLEDTLPEGTWTVVSNPVDLISGPVSGELEVPIGDLAVNGSVSFTLSRTVTVEDCGDIPNTATVRGSNESPDATFPNSDDANIEVLCTEIELEKEADASPIYPGDEASFTITVTNVGDEIAKGVVITDQLPAGVWTVETTPADLAYTIDVNRRLTVQAGDIPVDGAVTVTLSRLTATGECQTIYNEAGATATNEVLEDDEPQANMDSATIIVLCTEIALTKTATDAEILPGETASFTIEVANIGPNTARDVLITDQLPAGDWTVEIDPDTVTFDVDDDNKLTVSIDAIGVEAVITITISRETDFDDCGSIPNAAAVTISNEWPSTDEQDTAADNRDDALITVTCSDVELVKTPDGVAINAGQTATYTIVVTNKGPYAATEVEIEDDLPAGDWTVEVLSAPDGVDVNCGDNPKTGSFTCELDGTLAVNDPVTISVSRATTDQDCTTLENTARVSASNEPTDLDDTNEDSGSITVNCADLWVEKSATDGAASVNAGDPISFTIVVHNDGDGTATEVTLGDELPLGITWTLDTEDTDGCDIVASTTNPGGQRLACELGNLAPDAAIEIVVNGETDPTDCGVIENIVTIDATNVSDEPGQETGLTARATITVNCPILGIDKAAVTSPVSAGDSISFTITVTNTGAGVAYDVAVTDTLPTGITDWSENSASCEIENGVLECDFGDLPALTGSATVTITGTTSNAVCGSVPNTATASAGNFLTAGTAPTNKVSDSDTVVVDCPDVEIGKTAEPAGVYPGGNATFVITVTNNGPGNARGVLVEETLPDGEWLVTTGAGITCDTDNDTAEGTLECEVTGDLAPQGTRQVTVTRPVTTEDCGPLENGVTVSATNEDPAAVDEENSASATVTVLCTEIEVEKTAESDSINAGDTAAFTIIASNIGGNIAKDVVIEDYQLPSGEWTFTADDGVTCVSTGETTGASSGVATGTLTCTVGDLAVEGSVQIELSRETTDADCAGLVNLARVTTSNEWPSTDEHDTAADNEAEADITVNCADLTIVKEAAAETINAGDEISFTITVTNMGEGDAYEVIMTDVLPTGITWTADNTDDCEITNGTLTCDFGTLTAGSDPVSVTISGTTDALDCGEVENTATVDASNLTFENDEAPSSTATVTVECPELKIEKTAGAATINAGDDISFTITVTNEGEGDAYDVVVTDNLPTGIVWTADNTDDCEITNGTLTCDFGTLAGDGGTASVTIRGTTDALDCGEVENTATVDASNLTFENDEAPSSTATVTVNCPDLVVEKVAGEETINAGDEISFTITVTNKGEGDAYEVVLTDVLPTGITWTVSNTDDCNITNGTLTCDFGTLAADSDPVSVTISGTTDAEDCGVVENTATIDASNLTAEPTTAGDRSSTATVTVNCPNLVVEKVAGEETINAGDPISFTITVRNVGAGDAYDVVLTDVLPSGITWDVDDDDACTIENGTLTCEWDEILAGGLESVTISGTTDADDCGPVVNTATVDASNLGEPSPLQPNPYEEPVDPRRSTADVLVNCSDLTIAKEAAAETVNAGDEISFTITVTNIGDGDAYDVVVTDNLPTGIVWTADNTDDCEITNGTLTCDFGTLAGDGGTASVTIRGTTDALDCGEVENTATVDASNLTFENDEAPSSTATVTVNCPDLVVEKVAGEETINAGDEISFTITVTNKGEGDAYDVVLTDVLPVGITWDVDDDVACEIENGTLTCEWDVIASGDDERVTISGTTDANDCGIVENTATIDASNLIPVIVPLGVESDDPLSSTASVTVNCPDLVVEKVAEDDEINAGDDIAFTITVTNEGEGDAYDVVLIDVLPPGIDWDVDNGEACEIENGTLICTWAEIASGDDQSVTITGTTDANDCGVVENTATIDASNLTAEPTTEGDRSSTATVTVNCPNLVVEKVAGEETISSGDPISFTITVTNNGQGDAYDVILTDVLPLGITWSVDDTLACEIAEGVLTCEWDVIAAGGEEIVTISGVTDANDCGLVENTARVEAANLGGGVAKRDAEGEDETDPLRSTAEVMVNCPALGISKRAEKNTVNAGDEISFTITVTNDAEAGIARGVTVEEMLPFEADWTIVPSAGTCSEPDVDGKVVCSVGDIAAGGKVTIEVSAITTPDECGEVSNTAIAEATNLITDYPLVAVSIVTVNCPDLVIEKEANPASISAGDTANYTVTVTNNGAGTAYDVVVIDTLPFDAEWTFIPSAGTCTLPNEQGQVTCDLGDIVADGVVTIEVSAPTTATECGAQENRVTVDASNLTDEPTEPGDRAASATVTVNCPDLVVEKVAGEETINAGDEISFTITVTNNGAGTAYDVVLTDVLPLGITWDVDDEAACEIENGTLTCAWDEIVAGEHESVTISGTTDASDCGEVTNTATIEASNLTAEPTTEGDRSSTATVTVDCPVVSIDKLAVDSEGNETSTPIGPGDAVSFKIVVENSGDGSAYDVVITDTLPVGIAWTITSVIGSSDAIDTESCAIENGILTCDVGTMPADSTIAVTVSGLTPADSCNPIENSATVSSTNWSGRVLLAAETSASAVMPMNCPVEIQKVGPDGESPLAGACFTLTDGEVTFGPECVDENGRARFEMIPVGTYTVTETTTPVGYQPIEEFDIELVYGEIVTVTVINERQPLVVKLDCQVDPGAVDLDRLASDPAYAPEGCERVEGVAFTATANGEPIAGSFITGADGTARIPAVTGDELVITEDVTTATPGYLPRENPITIDPVPGTGGVAAFVNLPQDGELNLLKVICESDEARQPIFETVDSAGFQVPDGCWRGAGLSFTISGGDLTSPVTITTDRNGEANLTLRFGAYTVTEVSTGASTSITITANVTTYLRVTNFEPETPGVDPTPTPSPTKPIEELPDTGAGFTGGSMLMLILPMLALLLMVAGAMLMTNAKRNRRS